MDLHNLDLELAAYTLASLPSSDQPNNIAIFYVHCKHRYTALFYLTTLKQKNKD